MFFIAFATSVFFEPAGLVTGGVSGLGIVITGMLKDYIDIPLWVMNLALNFPIFIAAIKVKGFRFVIRTFIGTVLFSLALLVTSFISIRTEDLLLNAIFGAAITGLGLGLVLRANATTGGSDLLATVIHHKFKHLPIARILLVLDFTVIFSGFLVYGAEKSLYAIIGAFVTSKVIDTVLEGLSFAKAAYIISDKSDEIGRKLIAEMERGATELTGRGLYTGNTKNVILSVVSTKEIVQLKEITRKVDPGAFIIVSDVREVLGEGFIPNSL